MDIKNESCRFVKQVSVSDSALFSPGAISEFFITCFDITADKSMVLPAVKVNRV